MISQKAIALCFFTSLYTYSCALPEVDGNLSSVVANQIGLSSDAVPEDKMIESFTKHLHPELRICATCHGSTQAPLFAVDDPAAAYQALMDGNKIDFNNIARSRIVMRLTEDQHNCQSDCQEEGALFVRAITAWHEEMNQYRSETLNLVSTENIKPIDRNTLTYELGDQLLDGRHSIKLRMNIKPLASGGGYSLNNIEIETTSVDIFIKNVKPLVNNYWDSLNSSLTKIGCAVHIPSANFGSTTVNMGEEDELSFQFEELRLANQDDEVCGDQEQETSGVQIPAAKRNEYDNSMKGNLGRYCSCHDYSTVSKAWAGRRGMRDRINGIGRIMPPTTQAAQMSAEAKRDMLNWLTD